VGYFLFSLFFFIFLNEGAPGKAGGLPLTPDFAILIVRSRFDRQSAEKNC
jgi:hypothetical protein